MTGRPRSPDRPPEPILHVDLDAFYASVEVQKDPKLRGRPVVVAGGGTRGVVMSASYEARAFGVESAMPAVRARRLAPQAAFVAPDFESYRAYSNRFREVLLAHTPLVEPLALDEAFLDVGGAVMLFGSPPEIARRIRKQVRGELGFACSIGVAPNKFLAKLGSTRAKPDGMLIVAADGIQAFLDPLPVAALWGAGERTVETLSRLGIRTVGELAAVSPSVLSRVLGEAQARTLSALSRGLDDREVVPYEAPKSISHEETFEQDIDDDDRILRELLALSRRVASRLRADGYMARTIVLKVRLANFSTLTRSKTLTDPTDVAADVAAAARELYLRLPGARRRIRLLGVQATGLVTAGATQLALIRGTRWGDLERAVDGIERRFGRDSAMPATLLGRATPRGPGAARGSPEPPRASPDRPNARPGGQALQSDE